MTEADGSTIHWSYDQSYRLTGETMRDPSNALTYQAGYVYDPVGNRESATINGQTTSYSYNNLDQITTAATGSFTSQYSYNQRGDLTRITGLSGDTSYSWDAADHLIGATLPNGVTSNFAYDAAGRRVSQTIIPVTGPTKITNYLWDEASLYGDVVRETDGGGNQVASYVLANGQLLDQTQAGTLSYVLQDGHGSTGALTDANGNATDIYRYDAYGNLLSHQGTGSTPYLYAGQQFDTLTGLYDLRARYYQSEDGRFLSKDLATLEPTQPADLTRYLYVRDDAPNGTDPSGLLLAEEGLRLNETAEQIPTLARTGETIESAEVGPGLSLFAKFLYTFVPNPGSTTLTTSLLETASGETVELVTVNGFQQAAVNALRGGIADASVQVIDAFSNLQEGIAASATDHAEAVAVRYAQSINARIIAMGVSNVEVCAPCLTFLQQAGVSFYYIGEFI